MMIMLCRAHKYAYRSVLWCSVWLQLAARLHLSESFTHIFMFAWAYFNGPSIFSPDTIFVRHSLWWNNERNTISVNQIISQVHISNAICAHHKWQLNWYIKIACPYFMINDNYAKFDFLKYRQKTNVNGKAIIWVMFPRSMSFEDRLMSVGVILG